MSGEGTSTAQDGSYGEPAVCFLLIRAPSDRSIYEAFRAIAAFAKQGCIEHLWIEGDLPLTSGLCAPEVPATVERLLQANCEMIDKLELEFGGFRWTYLRAGGHTPFRESFFDEVRIEEIGDITLSQTELRSVFACTLSRLGVASQSATGWLSDLIAEIQDELRESHRTLSAEIGETRV
jgi:hypothetical protein